jgi:hypothetical protein
VSKASAEGAIIELLVTDVEPHDRVPPAVPNPNPDGSSCHVPAASVASMVASNLVVSADVQWGGGAIRTHASVWAGPNT